MASLTSILSTVVAPVAKKGEEKVKKKKNREVPDILVTTFPSVNNLDRNKYFRFVELDSLV
jgi:hypothetical protein